MKLGMPSTLEPGAFRDGRGDASGRGSEHEEADFVLRDVDDEVRAQELLQPGTIAAQRLRVAPLDD